MISFKKGFKLKNHTVCSFDTFRAVIGFRTNWPCTTYLTAEPVAERTKEKDPSANPKPQSSELVDEVFSLFKGYLIIFF